MRINWFQGSLPRAALFQMQMSFNPNLLQFEVLHTVCQETKAFLVICVVPDQRKDLDIASMAVERPWDEDPFTMSEEVMKNISLEVVREKLLDHVHQEIPYEINHRLMEWKELRDGSLRIEQHLITHKQSQRKIIVGKNGSKIGRIGVEANEELRSIFKRNVHLILQVRVK